MEKGSGNGRGGGVREAGRKQKNNKNKTTTIPAKAGISRLAGNARTALFYCHLRRWRGSREIHAFAGMGVRGNVV